MARIAAKGSTRSPARGLRDAASTFSSGCGVKLVEPAAGSENLEATVVRKKRSLAVLQETDNLADAIVSDTASPLKRTNTSKHVRAYGENI